MFFKLFVFTLFITSIGPLAAFAHHSEARLDQNDVSILMPLPESYLTGGLWAPNDSGQNGELLPLSFAKQLPELTEINQRIAFKNLRVVAVRIDPCFPKAPPQSGCIPQVRLVWQPELHLIELITQKPYSTIADAAIHTFYDLSQTEFKALIKRLRHLKTLAHLNTENEALTVNPILQRHGLKSIYARELKLVFLKYIGANRMSRIAFMQLLNSFRWSFGAFDLQKGTRPTQVQIPRIRATSQEFTNRDTTRNHSAFLGSIAPAPNTGDLVNETPARHFRVTEINSAFRIENPKLHNPHTIDCVSCHIAQPVRIANLAHFADATLEAQADRFRSAFNLNNTSPNPGKTILLRAFGYDDRSPAISQRVINETAHVLETIEPLNR